MYLPLAAVAILAVLLVDHAMGLFVGKKSFPAAKRITGIVLVSLCVIVPGLMTIRRNADYRNPETMWKLVLKNRPLNCRAYFNLGLYYHEHGREEDAITQCNNALECPNESIDISQIHALLANLLSDKKSYEESRRHFEEAIHINPQDVRIMTEYGISLARQNQLERAAGVFRQALVLQPDNSIIHYDLGNTLEMQGKFQEAMDHYGESIRLNPEFPEVHRNLGDLLYKRGEWDAALQEYEKALRLKPNWREVREILNQIHKQKHISKQSPE
jgi:tetratricopeptide (TPR) repeat protein